MYASSMEESNSSDQITEQANALDNCNCNNIKLQMLGIAAWIFQAGLFFVAMSFRYSGEATPFMGQYWRNITPSLSRPELLDWPGLSLAVAVGFIIYIFAAKSTRLEKTLPDAARVGSLLCMAVFSLSSGSIPSSIGAIIGMWICVAASTMIINTKESPTVFAAVILVVACLISAYMFVQTGLTKIELIFIVFSSICGVASTGLCNITSKKLQLALPVWFTLLIAVFCWYLGAQPSVRMIFMFELSGVFIAGRHLYFSITPKN